MINRVLNRSNINLHLMKKNMSLNKNIIEQLKNNNKENNKIRRVVFVVNQLSLKREPGKKNNDYKLTNYYTFLYIFLYI
jgi:hypothetical protein